MKTGNRFTLLAAFAALLAFSTYAFAQPSDAKIDRKIDHRVVKMTKKLNLSDAQVAQVKAIINDSKPQIKADWKKIKAVPDDQREPLRATLRADKSAMKEKLLAVLNPEQRAKAEKFIERHKKQSDERNGK